LRIKQLEPVTAPAVAGSKLFWDKSDVKTIAQQNTKGKYSELQRRGRALTKRIRAAELGRDQTRVELLFQKKAELIAKLRECYGN
jgi:hypothetical protein